MPSFFGTTLPASFHAGPWARRYSFCAASQTRSSSQAAAGSGTVRALPFFGGYSRRVPSSSSSMVRLTVTSRA